MKNEWKILRGGLRVMAKAQNENTGKFIIISIEIEVDKNISNCDFIDNLDDAIRSLANLRNAYNPEIIDIEKLY